MTTALPAHQGFYYSFRSGQRVVFPLMMGTRNAGSPGLRDDTKSVGT
jgi:hypothetical protein